MDEATNWQLEIIHRDLFHQVEWMERNGVLDAARDAAKVLRDSGIIDVMERADLNPIIDGFNALTNSGVVTRKSAGEARTAESIKDNGNGSKGSTDGATVAKTKVQKKNRIEKRGKRGKLSKAEKIAAVKEWDMLDKSIHPNRLDEWLEQRFGTDNGVLRVAVSTFHSWRKLRD